MNKEQAIADLCYELDQSLYIPFKRQGCFKGTNYGYKKELFKEKIEEIIKKIDKL